MRKLRLPPIIAASIACAGLLLPTAVEAADAAPIRTLIFSGHNNHDWRSTTPYLRKLLRDSGRFDVRVIEEPAGITPATLAGYDLIVLDYMGPRWGDAAEKAFLDFVNAGKGVVGVHGATYAFTGLEVLGDGHKPTGLRQPPWPEYLKLIGGYWVEGPAKTAHGQRHSFQVKFADRAHPIANGMPESFWATDELYHNMRMQPGAKVLGTAFSDPKTGGTGKEEPILWSVNYGGGRVFYTALGHDVAAMQEAGFIESFVRGAEWAATGKVTLPTSTDWVRFDKNPVRALLVTGGHDHDASFYAQFQGQRDLSVWTDAHPAAFGKDMRPRFDVLILYDMTQEIGDKQRQNLRDFVESGKGVVVVHHAIADFNNWEWWYREVVGGRYMLKPDGSLPASTYKHDEELFVRPVEKHPITEGIGPMHLWDETYKSMWISPDVKVLLRTDNPTSDGPVAWVSPYTKSRVVYVQLGHGPESHLHAGYQELMKRAILWAAGRLE